MSTVFYGPCIQELKLANFDVSNAGDSSPIEVFIRVDVAGFFILIGATS